MFYYIFAVCGVFAGVIKNTVLSASWDKMACIWKLDSSVNPLATFSGHQSAVWCVIQLNGGDVVTGSADKSIKIWKKEGSLRCTLTGMKVF